jgi:hypothetical protein
MQLTNAQKHLKLLEVPQRERNAVWFDKVNSLLSELELVCYKCQTPFSKKVFTDEVKDEPKQQLCIICLNENT